MGELRRTESVCLRLAGAAAVLVATAGCGSAAPTPAISPAQDASGAMALLAQEGVCADDPVEVDLGSAEPVQDRTLTCRTAAGEPIDAWDGDAPFSLVGADSGIRIVRGSGWTVVCPSTEVGELAAAVTGGTLQPR